MTMTPDQHELTWFMSGISEDAYCAGWMFDLEYSLWDIIHNDGDFGMRKVTRGEKIEMLRLSQLIGGWIHWVEGEENKSFINKKDWEKKYEQWRREQATRRDQRAESISKDSTM